jgi:hypothetical protein
MLDPVFVDRSGARAAVAQALVRMRPAVIRLNRDEFAAMAAAQRLARRTTWECPRLKNGSDHPGESNGAERRVRGHCAT